MSDNLCERCGLPVIPPLRWHEWHVCVQVLKDKVRELEADQARLDWIERKAEVDGRGSGYGIHVDLPEYPDCEKDGSLLREAIDAARAATKGEKESAD